MFCVQEGKSYKDVVKNTAFVSNDSYYSADMYMGTVSNAYELRSALYSNNYLFNEGLWFSSAVGDDIKVLVNNPYPLLLVINTSSIDFTAQIGSLYIIRLLLTE